jgi:hypothetical protein
LTQNSSKEWYVEKAHGDHYFRAILFDVINGICQKNNYSLHLLSRTEYKTVRVELKYRTGSSLDLLAEPIVIKSNGNKIMITVTNKDPDDIALNLVGAVTVVSEYLADDFQYNDFELRKLRTSPAFRAPIDR